MLFRRNEPVRESQEILVAREAQAFRAMALSGWSQDTIYPKSEYIPGSSQGQCGITNYGFGIWLVWTDTVKPEKLTYEEGVIVSATGELLGGDHAWLHVQADPWLSRPIEMRLDLAGDQFPEVTRPVMVQYPEYFVADSERANAVYRPFRREPLLDYDTAAFRGRLLKFMSTFVSELPQRWGVSNRAASRLIPELWWPKDTTMTKDAVVKHLVEASGIQFGPGLCSGLVTR